MSRAHTGLVVALDVDSAAAALELAGRLHGAVDVFKAGLELFTASGPAVVRGLREQGEEVFLDLKLHDIPNTVAGAVRAAARLEVQFLTLHVAGGEAMLRAAVAAAGKVRLLGVTILTSLDDAALAALNLPGAVEERVVGWARLAQGCGLAGVVASPREAALIRAAVGPDFLIVTPGIRPAGTDAGDQARIATPADAIRAGADYLVVGRPICAAGDPAAAAAAIRKQMAAADESRTAQQTGILR